MQGTGQFGGGGGDAAAAAYASASTTASSHIRGPNPHHDVLDLEAEQLKTLRQWNIYKEWEEGSSVIVPEGRQTNELYNCPPTTDNECPETIDDGELGFNLFCTAPEPDACAQASVTGARVDCGYPDRYYEEPRCRGATLTQSSSRCNYGGCDDVTFIDSLGSCLDCDGVTGIGSYFFCVRPDSCAGLLAYQSYLECVASCDGATLICNSNPDVPGDVSLLPLFKYPNLGLSSCDYAFRTDQDYCKICLQADSCPNDRVGPGTIGTCSDEQIEEACEFLCDRGVDASDVLDCPPIFSSCGEMSGGKKGSSSVGGGKKGSSSADGGGGKKSRYGNPDTDYRRRKE
ncbi:MAG: hypothetical protein SGARI_000210 [Bacillariaceae sp.]